MNRIISFIAIAIVSTVLWLLFFKDAQYIPKQNDLSNYQLIDQKIDTEYINRTFIRWKKGDSIPYKVVDSVHILVHDTVYIISDYNRIYAYSDTIKQDSNIFVIDDTITQNRIKSRSFKANITEKIIYDKQYYAEKQKNSVFLGIRGVFSGDNSLEVLSPGLMLNAKIKAY